MKAKRNGADLLAGYHPEMVSIPRGGAAASPQTSPKNITKRFCYNLKQFNLIWI